MLDMYKVRTTNDSRLVGEPALQGCGAPWQVQHERHGRLIAFEFLLMFLFPDLQNRLGRTHRLGRIVWES